MAIRVLSRVFDISRAKSTELLVLLALADRADEDGVCWPALDTLAERARLTDRRSVRRILRGLEDMGEIYTLPGLGRGNTSLYVVTAGCSADAIATVLVKRCNLPIAEATAIAAGIIEKGDNPAQKGTDSPPISENKKGTATPPIQTEKGTDPREKGTAVREKGTPRSPDPLDPSRSVNKGGDAHAREAGPTPPPPPPRKSEKKSTKPDPEYDAVADFLRQKGFRLAPDVRSSRIVAWLGRYPPDWIMRAAAVAEARGVRKLAYVGGILRGFAEEGGPDDDSNTRPANRHPGNNCQPAQPPGERAAFDALADLNAQLKYGDIDQAAYDAAVARLNAQFPGVLNL